MLLSKIAAEVIKVTVTPIRVKVGFGLRLVFAVRVGSLLLVIFYCHSMSSNCLSLFLPTVCILRIKMVIKDRVSVGV